MAFTPYTPPGLPTTALLPAPVGLPPTNNDPRMGANPYSTGPMVTPLKPYISDAEAAALTGMGLPASSGMTEQEAVAQSDRALAKLAMVNPKLAQELSDQRENTSGGGWFGFLKDVASTFLHPVLSVGGQALELISRTGHIVPQWFDPTDKGNFIEDIGQALSGEDKTNWNEVFQNRGWLKNIGWLRATVGFGLDVATDPISYATFGASAGVSTSSKAAHVGEVLFTHGEQASKLAALLGKSGDETAEILARQWSKFSVATENIAQVRAFADYGDELLGMVQRSAQGEVKGLLADAWETGALAYQKVYGRTWKNFINSHGTLTLSSGTVVHADQMKPVFEAIIKAGQGVKYSDSAWAAAKMAAGSMGGLRFRYAIPFTQFRYITPMLPYSYKLGLGTLGRFGAGLSGYKVMEKLGPEAETLFVQKGWKGLNELSEQGDQLAKSIVDHVRAGRAPSWRSAFYSASENAGRFTASFSPGAKLFRRGLGYYFFRNGIKNAQDLRRRLTNDLFYAIAGGDKAGAEVRSDIYRRYDKYFGARALGKVDNPEEYARAARKFEDYFGAEDIPHTAADVQNGNLEQWFWSSRPDRHEAWLHHNAQASTGVTFPAADDYARHAAVLEDMKKTVGMIPEDAARVLDDLHATERFGKETLEKHGIDIGDSVHRVEEMRVIHPVDRILMGRREAWLDADHEVLVPSEGSAISARYGGITPEYEVPHEDLGLTGVRIDLRGGGSNHASVPAQLRVHNVVDVNMEDIENAVEATADEVISGTATLPQILKAVDKSFENGGEELAKHLNPMLDNHILRLEWEASTRADLATKALRAQPDAPDAVRFLRDGTPESMVVFDSKRVHVVSENAPIAQPAGGYWRRVLNPRLREKIGGVADKNGHKLFGDPGQVEIAFRRETRDMTLEESETYIRNKVNAAGGKYEGITVAADEPVWEWDVLKGHEEYIGYLGDSYFSVAMGRTSKRMLQLGQMVPGQFGAMASTARAMFQMPNARLRDLARSERSIQDAFVKVQQRLAVAEARAGKTNLDAHNRLSLMLAYMEAGLSAEDIPAMQLSSAMDGVVRASANLQKVVARETQRLNAKVGKLQEDLAITKKVEDSLNVTEFRELDDWIDSRLAPLYEDPVTNEMMSLKPMKERESQRWGIKLARQQRDGTAVDMGEGVWRIEDNFNTLDGEVLPGRAYLVVDANGKVIHSRTIDSEGQVIAQSAEPRSGAGMKAIMAHWHDEGVTDMAGVKRVIDGNTLSESAVGLNKKAARAILKENGLHDPEVIRDLLYRGELYVGGPDQSILTKSMGIRKGGRRVMSREELEAEIAYHEQQLLEIDDLRGATPKRDVQAEQAARGGLTGAQEQAAQDDFAAWLDEATGATPPPANDISDLYGWDGVEEAVKSGRREDLLNMAQRFEEGGKPDLAARVRAYTDSLATGPKKTIYTHQVTYETFEQMQERLHLLAEASKPKRTVAQAQAAKRFSTAGERVQRATAAEVQRAQKEMLARGGVEARAAVRVREATNELNRAQAEVQGVWSEMKPAIMFDLPPEGGKMGLRQVQIPGMNGVYAHPYVAEEMEYMLRGKPVGQLMTWWRQFLLGPWKRWATYRNPGFHVRNFFGAWFNNKLGGVDLLDEEFSRKVNMARGNKGSWATTPLTSSDWKRYNFNKVYGMQDLEGVITYGDVSEMLADMGIGRANTTTLALTMGGEGLRDKARGSIGGVFAKIDGGLRNVGGLTEDFFRVSAWAGGMRHLDGDLYGARAFTMVRHGDYGDLTDTEDWVRDLVPFYKWMRTNVPYQLRMLAENPGMFATVDKAQTFVYDVQGLDRYEHERNMPEWMRRGFNIPVPKGFPIFGQGSEQNFILADLPYTDLYNGFRDYLSAGLPVIRNVIESFGIKQNTFTGAPLGERMVPLSGLWANPVLAPILQAMPFAQKGADGQTYIPDTFENVLAAVPVYSRFRNWMLSDPDRVQNRASTFTSALLGFSVRSEDLTAAELGFYYDELLPAMSRLKDMGYTLPTADELHAAGSAMVDYGAAPSADTLFPTGVVGTLNQAA